MPVELKNLEYFSEPYPHCHTIKALETDAALNILQWMEADAPWTLVETDFYEQYEFNLRKVDIPDHLNFLISESFITAVLRQMANTFNTALTQEVEVVAHKLIPGQSIRIHNDFLEGEETHRLVIQLNAGWTNDNGGLFIVFSSPDAEDIYRVITPQHNSAVGFAIQKNSHHAVSTIYSDIRYSLIFSFRTA